MKPPAAPRSRELGCPVCGAAMSEAAVEGVTADVCATHGMWLDKGELAAIVTNVRSAQQKRAKRVVRRAALTDLAQQAADRQRAFVGGVWAAYFLKGR